MLKARYDQVSVAGTKLWDAIPEKERQQIAENPIWRHLFIDMPSKAANAHRSGWLMCSADNMKGWQLLLSARSKNERIFNAMKNQSFAKMMEATDAQVIDGVQAVFKISSPAAACQQGIPAIALQLCAEFYDKYQAIGLIVVLQMGIDRIMADIAKLGERDARQLEELRTMAIELRGIQLLVVHAVREDASGWIEETKRVGQTLPDRALTGDTAAVERLFYSAYLAADGKLEKDVIKTATEGLQAAPDEVKAYMTQADPSLGAYQPLVAAMAAVHRETADQKGKPSSRAAEAVAAHVYANSLVIVSGLITRWSELDLQIDANNKLRYGRTDLLNYLINTARENALANISLCARRGIPPVQPIASFEQAEMARDDNDEDGVGVLTNYWNATLQAKVLLMLFSAP